MKKPNPFLCLLIVLFTIKTTYLKAQDTKTDANTLKGTSDDMKKIMADTSKKHWQKGGTVSLSGQEVTLTNWAAGGQGAISVGGLINLFFYYHKEKWVWNTDINMAYGVIKNGSSKDWLKTNDRIQLTSKVGREAFKNAYYSALFDFKTQFAPGYNYPNDSVRISNFLAPAYGILALGLDWQPKPYLSFFIAPATTRLTYVGDNTLARAGAYGVQAQVLNPLTGAVITPYNNMLWQFGGYARMQFQKDIMTNVNFATMVEVFSNYLKNPQNIYVNWTTLTSMKVNKFISATFSTQLIYDPLVKYIASDGSAHGPRIQFKQVLAVGFTYKF
ncbi:MAG: DUF3078 domain-containing protein [Bacteroidetes bacterium]|nr:DUF3078 domain-containing protein [Bacteroidota bacterium]